MHARNNAAYSVGTNYNANILSGEINTSDMAETADRFYSNAGYRTILNVVPTRTNLTTYNSEKVYNLESSIVFLAGHADSTSMAWNYKNQGGNYDVQISSDKRNYEYSNGVYEIGMTQYNNKENRLVIFAGCHTAQGDSNIAKVVQQNGAETTLGWKEEVAVGSFRTWTERFNKLIVIGGNTVKNVALTANNHIYMDNRIKNYVIYGNQNNVLSNNRTIAQSSKKDERSIILNKTVSDANATISTESMIEIINEQLIKFEPNINLSDYKIEKNGNDFTYYDYVLYVDGIRTNLGFTIITKENKILSITDHTKNLDISKKTEYIKDLMLHKNLSSNYINDIATDTLNKAKKENMNLDSLIQKKEVYYDTDKDELYLVTMIELETKRGQKSILDLYEKL